MALRDGSKYVATPVCLRPLVPLSWPSRQEMNQTCSQIHELVGNECVSSSFEKINWSALKVDLDPHPNSGDAPNKERQ